MGSRPPVAPDASVRGGEYAEHAQPLGLALLVLSDGTLRGGRAAGRTGLQPLMARREFGYLDRCPASGRRGLGPDTRPAVSIPTYDGAMGRTMARQRWARRNRHRRKDQGRPQLARPDGGRPARRAAPSPPLTACVSQPGAGL